MLLQHKCISQAVNGLKLSTKYLLVKIWYEDSRTAIWKPYLQLFRLLWSHILLTSQEYLPDNLLRLVLTGKRKLTFQNQESQQNPKRKQLLNKVGTEIFYTKQNVYTLVAICLSNANHWYHTIVGITIAVGILRGAHVELFQDVSW